MRNVEEDIDYTTDERGTEQILPSKEDIVQTKLRLSLLLNNSFGILFLMS